MTTARTHPTGGVMKYPQLAHDEGRQILIWEQDDLPLVTPGGERIYEMERCGTGAWSAPALLRTPTGGANSAESQSIQIGRPRIVLNRNDNVAHVVLTENGTSPTTGELWWMRRSYTDCP